MQVEPDRTRTPFVGAVRSRRALARATLCMFASKLNPYHRGEVVCFDVPQFVTHLRTMIWQHRGKEQAATGLQQAQFATHTPDTPIPSTTTFKDLLAMKAGWLPLFIADMKEALLVAGGLGDAWDPARLVPAGTFLAIVGGTDACAIRVADDCEWTGAELRDMLDGSQAAGQESSVVARQGEGEGQILKGVMRYLAAAHKKGAAAASAGAGAAAGAAAAAGGVDAALRDGHELLCRDVDCLGGRLMPASRILIRVWAFF